MKQAIAILIALCCGLWAVYADPSEEAQTFLRVEDSQWSYSALKEEHFKRSSFPNGLWEVVEGYFRPYGIDREDYVGFTHDLNGDGQKEYFVETPLGGSGGPYFTVVTLRDGKWVEIASFQGGFHLLRVKNGWLPIVGSARGGADNYYKFRLEMHDGVYREVWAANFSGGKITEKKIEQGRGANALPRAAHD